jgi:hypothetical protein
MALISGGFPKRFLRPFPASASVRVERDHAPVAHRSNAQTTRWGFARKVRLPIVSLVTCMGVSSNGED